MTVINRYNIDLTLAQNDDTNELHFQSQFEKSHWKSDN